MSRSLIAGAKDGWRTPPDLYRRLDSEFGFAVDAACETDNCLAPWGFYRDQGRDALAHDWHVYSEGAAVWCNPPYSALRPWMEKGRAEGRLVRVVMLVPADTSTRWWREFVADDASEVRFLVGRPRFRRPDGSEHKTASGGGGLTTPSALVIYTPAGGPPRYSYQAAREEGARQALAAAR